MKVKKITGTRSHLDVELEDKAVRMIGELLINGFAVEKGGISKWTVPEGEPVTKEELEELKRAVAEYTKDKKFKISFD